MEQKYNSRPIEVEDYAILMKWWKSYDGIEIPDSSILPNNGLGGFLIEKEGKMIAAAYLYLTNSAVGYIDFLISDPNYKGRDRYNIIANLILICSDAAVAKGCKLVWAMTKYDGVIKRCEDLGGEILDDKYTVIYTHESRTKTK
jgi:hypothetical protein